MTEPEQQRTGRGWIELIGVVIGAMLLALLIQWLLVKPYRIPSPSMVPTLMKGQRILVDRLTPRLSGPERGQIWVFHPPKGADYKVAAAMCGVPTDDTTACLHPKRGFSKQTYIKRVVGVPGDHLSVIAGHVLLNGHRVAEAYTDGCQTDRCTQRPFTVPAGHYFMMGDNRGDSQDSRFWGPVARGEMIGRAFATYWPIKRIGGL